MFKKYTKKHAPECNAHQGCDAPQEINDNDKPYNTHMGPCQSTVVADHVHGGWMMSVNHHSNHPASHPLIYTASNGLNSDPWDGRDPMS